MHYFFVIAGMKICLDIPFSFEIGEDSIPFLSAPISDPDVIIPFLPTSGLTNPPDAIQVGMSRIHYSPKGLTYYRYSDTNNNPFAAMCWYDNAVCYYDEKHLKALWCTQNIWNAIGLETLLLRNNRMIIHASFIRVYDRAILFSAPCGTGKSTQATLWQKYNNAEILNGDRAALYCENGIWTAFGLPFAGSSGIYKNESAPVSAIVYLKQSSTNQLTRISSSQALRLLMPELNLCRWDREFMSRALALTSHLLESVQFMLLECLPDTGAVELLHQGLFDHQGERQ